ncbi:MAG TPA: response regulator [Burkholderiales bacterium]|nr:response regulator [Burkholderiales bacterium]
MATRATDAPSALGPAAGEPLQRAIAEAEAPGEVPRAKILIVDDEPKSLYALQELLASLGQELMVAASGEEALKLVLRHDFAVILLDVRMPGMDGFETAKMIRGRERSRRTPIIFLTAQADEMNSMFRGYAVGAVDYLMKPVVPEVLKSKVAVFVELFMATARLRASEDKLRRLAAHLISVREEERTHIAREIHDELGQVLTGLKMEVGWLARRLKEPALLEKTESMSKLIDSSVQTVRKIATGLRPEMLDDMGLIAAVAWQAKEFQKRTGIRCRTKLAPETKLDLEVSTTVFRIFQEILTNVARHARATRVDIELELAEDQLRLEVTDNGVGIAEEDLHGRKSLGLLGMQERALLFGGEVSITGTPGHGTRVAVTIPLRRAGEAGGAAAATVRKANAPS